MKRAYRQHIYTLLIMAALAIFMSYPVIFHLRHSLAGKGGDPWQAMWRFEHKGSGGYQDLIRDFSGTGGIGLTNISVWPWMPLHYVFGEPVAYNLVWILNMVLSGYAMALFIKLLTNQEKIASPAPLLAGIAYMLLPYRSAHALGHFGAMQLQWIPFLCAAILVYIRKPTIWKIALVGVLFSVQAWSEHHYALWMLLFGVVVIIAYRKELAQRLRGSRITSGMTTHTLLLLLILIFGVIVPYIPTIQLARTNSDALELGREQTIRFSADLFSFITPSPQHPLWGSFFDRLFGQYFTGNDAESVQYLGVSIIIVILFFHRHIPVRQKRLWIYAIIVFGLISLGPVLHVFGRETSIPLPYALIAHLPVFSAIRVVARAGALVGFAVCVLFGWAIATNIHRPRTAIIAGIVILLEFLFLPFPMQSATLSPVYHEISTLPGSRIIEIPAATNYTSASRSLYASALHGKEVIGNIALERGQSEEAYELSKSVPGIRQLLYLRTTELLDNRPEFFQQNLSETLPDAMKWLDAAAIIVHTDSLSPVQQQAISRFLTAIPALTKRSFGDADLYVLNPPKVSSDGVFLTRGEGWENIGYDPKRDSVFAEIPKQASITVINTNIFPTPIRISFSVPPEGHANIQLRDAQGIHNFVQNESMKFTTVVFIGPGATELTLVNTGGDTAIIQNPIFFMVAHP